MSPSKPRNGAEYERGDPEDTYDAFDYEDEISDDDAERCISEGILRQEDQPQAPRPQKNPYMQAMSSLVKRGKKIGRAERVEKAEPASSDNVLGPSRCLISHDHLTSLSPELAAAFDSEGKSCLKGSPPNKFILIRIPWDSFLPRQVDQGAFNQERRSTRSALGPSPRFTTRFKAPCHQHPAE